MGITSVAGVPVQPQHRATCHCGTVELLLDLPDGIVDPRRCDCSMCRRRGAIAASVTREGLQVVRGQNHLRLYQFNTHVAEHYFCGVCGIYTHHRRRSNPEQYGYNVACLEGIDPFALGVIPVNDGVNHLVPRTSQRCRHFLPGRHAAAAGPRRALQPGPAGCGLRLDSDRGRKGSTAGPEMIEQPHGGSPWGTGTIETRRWPA